MIENPEESVFLNSDKKLKFFTNELVNDLSKQVVDDWERELIEKTSTIVDMQAINEDMKKTKLSPDIYSENSFPKFKEAVDYLEIPGLKKIDDLVIKNQYKNYIQLISSLASREECVIEPRKVILRLFNSSEKLYENLQIVNHIIAVAVTKSSTESVLESYVSMYEYTSNSRKNYSETGLSDTFEIQKDGPLVTRCDGMVKIALDRYFSDKKTNGWHFVMKKSENLMRTSKTLKKYDEKQSDIPFME